MSSNPHTDFVPNRNPLLHPHTHGHSYFDYNGDTHVVIHSHPHRDAGYLVHPIPHTHVYAWCHGQSYAFALLDPNTATTPDPNAYQYADQNMVDPYTYPYLN